MKRWIIMIAILSFLVDGCAVVVQKGRRSDIEKIRQLERELSELRRSLRELEHTKSVLEERLAKEIENKQVSLKMQERGLVVTFVAEILFDPGKAKLKKESLPILDKVAKVLKEDVPSSYRISIEGHTDNQPIKYSGWKSNWELSVHRALSVLHYLEKKGVSPERLSATGFGEYQPVASNQTEEGRALNRRVEIIIIPSEVKKVKKELISSLPPKEPTTPQEESVTEVLEEEELK